MAESDKQGQWLAVTTEQGAELYRLLSLYQKEVHRCSQSRAHLVACAILGAQLKALLFSMVNIYSEEAEATGKIARQGKGYKLLLDWKLIELLRIPKAAGWLPVGLELTDDWDHRKAKVGDYAEVVRQV
jgi:hypothetical protein